MRKINLEQYRGKIKEMYSNEKQSLREIAKEIGVCMGTVRTNMDLWGIERRPIMKRELRKPSKEELEQIYYNKNKSIDQILKQLDIGLTTLFRWLRGYGINPIRRFKYKKSNFSGDLKEKAYILGLVSGDIHARKHGRQILAELTTTHPAMINLFYSTFQKYGMPQKYLKYNKKIKRFEWRAYILLNDSFNFMLSKNFNNKAFYDFLAGFFDCEGCLFIYNNHNFIGLSALIYNSNKNLLGTIKKRLKRDGLHPKLSKYFNKGEKTTNNYFRKKDLWAIRLHTNQEVIALIKRMPIKHEEKIAKFKIIESIKSNRWAAISNEVINLRDNLKREVKNYINPK